MIQFIKNYFKRRKELRDIKQNQKDRQEQLDNFALERTLDDNMISDKEYKEIEEKAEQLNIDISGEYSNYLSKYRDYFRIISNTLSPIDVDISLDKDEKCYMSCFAKWSEYRKVSTGTINYAGPVARLRICKGLSYRIGSIAIQRPDRKSVV